MSLNYPIKRSGIKKLVNKANLGMDLETLINSTNEYYLTIDKAVIYKKPTPVQIVKVDYPSRNKAVITEAYYKTPSTTDYNGIYKGKYIDFECKECHSTTSFPLANIHPHQISHLQKIIAHGGIGFLIVSFNKYNEFYVVPFDFINSYWISQENLRKSIPYKAFKDNCYLIKETYAPSIDYLKVIDEIYFKNNL